MLGSFASRRSEIQAKLKALDKSQAVIEFHIDGKIITANENFLKVLGYELAEIQGRHHSMFVDPGYEASAEYHQFWAALNRGEYQSGEFRRRGKNNKEVWIQASYNPILGRNGRPYKIIKYAADVTAQKTQNADYSGQIAAISKSHAMIQFALDGTVMTANENFLDVMGYSLAEIQGRHHSMFVAPDDKASDEYRRFWAALGRGEYQAAEYKRVGRNGKEVWISASYNPIFDTSGKPFKVVKYATDITQQVLARAKGERVQKMIEESLGHIDEAISNAAQQSVSASGASAQTSANVQAVAAGAEELNVSVREIAESMSRSQAAVDSASERTAQADQATQRLSKAAQSMGSIVDLIKDVAGQINLLALNATIEAARAGDAGKGFAVVAGEVKNLANQSAKATEEIAREIEGIQVVSNDVVKALDVIRESVGSVREYIVSTAGAVEQQSAVAREISDNMQTAARAVSNITDSIGEIANATQLADSSTKQLRDAAHTLAQ